jgi:Fructose-1,6-bisphosphate aldolase
VNQQFELARRSLPPDCAIVEPEVDIHCPEKAKAEGYSRRLFFEKLNQLPAGQLVMLKLPTRARQLLR